MEALENTRIIDLSAIRHNVRAMRAQVPDGTGLLAVVKADAYGHGAVRTARAALEAGASWLAVARVEEGVLLRDSGVSAPILVLGLSSAPEARKAAELGITLTVCEPSHIAMLAGLSQPVDCHLKLDTGMGRIGARTAGDVQAVLKAASEAVNVRITGVFTHFADADGEDMAYTQAQLERFRALSGLLPAGVIRHCANSAAIHRLMPEAAFDLVRMGISLYGYPPVTPSCELRPAMRWIAPVTYVKDVPAGDSVSYGRTWTAPETRRIATVACGYGDGYHRHMSGRAQVLIHGRRAPVVGRICMDQMMVDVTGLADVKPGDTATLMGADGEGFLSAEELAAWADTISYEVLLAGTGRVRRLWLDA